MVIQRWQSVLLLCAVVLQAVFTFCSLGQMQTPDFTLNFTSMGFTYEGIATGGGPSGTFQATWGLFAISLLSAVLPLIAIFTYRNLPMQIRMCGVEILVLLAAFFTMGAYGYCTIDNCPVSWSTLALAPVLSIFAVVMAMRRIKADKKKLDSLDRFR